METKNYPQYSRWKPESPKPLTGKEIILLRKFIKSLMRKELTALLPDFYKKRSATTNQWINELSESLINIFGYGRASGYSVLLGFEQFQNIRVRIKNSFNDEAGLRISRRLGECLSPIPNRIFEIQKSDR